MKVVVGSGNASKIAAANAAFSKNYKNTDIECVGVEVQSGISDHPISAQESIKGSINRAEAARAAIPDADYYIGMEGGLLKVDDRYWEFGWIAIYDKHGALATALSPGIELKGKLLDMVLSGVELSLALEKTLGLKDVGKNNGFYGLATDDVLNREQAYSEGIIFALAQFTHPELFA